MRSTVKTAFIKTLPVMAGYLVLGFGFGLISEKNGYGILYVLAMSGFIFAGSMQYVLIGLLTSGASLLTTALTTLMVNARHLFYGVSMIGPYQHAGKRRPYLIFALIFFLGGIISGASGVVAMAAPLAFAALEGTVPLMILFMCMSHGASLISPTHVCLVVAADYFHVSMGELIRKTIPASLIFCGLMLLYYNLLIII